MASVLAQAEVATSGTADSFMKPTHVKRTARSDQMAACALYQLQHLAYTECIASQPEAAVCHLKSSVNGEQSEVRNSSSGSLC